MRKMIMILLTILLGWYITNEVRAATGTIRVEIGGEGTVTLHRVGMLELDHYRLTDEHGGGMVTFDDILSDELAAWLAKRAVGGISRETERGIAVFTELEEGLYLAVQTDGGYFAPVLISLPWDGDTWLLDIRPVGTQSPQTGDRGTVIFSALVMAGAMLGLIVVGSRKKY